MKRFREEYHVRCAIVLSFFDNGYQTVPNTKGNHVHRTIFVP